MKTLEVVAAIIVRNKTFFAAQRGEHKYIGYKFEFPGGKVEPGEDYVSALKREIREELLIHVDVHKHFMTISHEYPAFIVNLHTYICSLTGEEPVLTEHVSAKWLDKETLFSVEWAEADYPVLTKLIDEKII